MKYLIIALICFLSLSISSQTEIELRNDGIVVPRLDTSAVAIPTIGQVIYDTNANQLMYYDGSNWSTISSAFVRNGSTIRQRKGSDTDDFVFGRNDLPPETPISDTFFFYDKSNSAFRGGLLENSNNWAEDSLGSHSFSYGYNTRASGDYGSTALGYKTIASGDYGATAIGSRTIASGIGATSLGSSTRASGGNGATALGDRTNANGEFGSTALGYQTEASGDYGATALGHFTKAKGDYGATALGFFSEAKGDYGATALGYVTMAHGDNCTVVGQYNDTIVSAGQDIIDTSPLFIIGNGNLMDGNPSNALAVLKNGKVGIGTNIPSSHLHLSYDSESGDGQLKLTEKGPDGARIILEKDKNHNRWTIFSEPSSRPDESVISFRFNETTEMPGNKFEVFGNGDATLEGMLTQNSDRRLKTNIEKIDNPFDIIRELNGYRYNWKKDSQNPRKQIGVMAQEAQKALPEIVKTNEKGTLSISYSSLIPVLIEGMKEQQELIDKQNEAFRKQQEELNQQKQINSEYENRISKLESMVLSITGADN